MPVPDPHPYVFDKQWPLRVADIDREGLADLMGSLMTGLARTAAAAGDLGRYTAAVAVLERFLTEGAVISRR